MIAAIEIHGQLSIIRWAARIMRRSKGIYWVDFSKKYTMDKITNTKSQPLLFYSESWLSINSQCGEETHAAHSGRS
jgi:hypothetical protein